DHPHSVLVGDRLDDDPLAASDRPLTELEEVPGLVLVRGLGRFSFGAAVRVLILDRPHAAFAVLDDVPDGFAGISGDVRREAALAGDAIRRRPAIDRPHYRILGTT